jgi:uncharacterized protein
MSASDAGWEAELGSNPRAGLLQCLWQGRREFVVDLLRRNPELLRARLSGNVTPLLAAAYARHYDLADGLLAMGAEMDYITAIALNRRIVVETMLDQQPNLIRKQAPDRIGCLHVAARFADGDLVSMLLLRGADVNDSRNPRRLTPIFFAWDQPFKNVEILILAGADVNARSKHGFTSLHFAAWQGRLEFVKVLLRHGAEPTAQTAGRQTPWSLAVRAGHRDVAALLSSA